MNKCEYLKIYDGEWGEQYFCKYGLERLAHPDIECVCCRYRERFEEYFKNLDRVEIIKTFMGGDNEDVPVYPEAIEHMKYIVEQCNRYSVPQPEIFPWAGGNGVQAEWTYDWYIEIDSCDKGISILMVKGTDYDNAISTNISDVKTAFLLVKEFITYVVDLEGNRGVNHV